MFRGKKYQESAKQIDKAALYDTNEAMELVVKTAPAKFDETVELHVKLGVDSRHADQQVRGAIVLPHGTGKTQRVLVFAQGRQGRGRQAAGADFVGEMDLVEKIQKENWFDYDVVVASPDMMGVVGRLGKVLGPKGLMPSPKAGTVTPDVAKAVTEIKAGRWSTVWTRPTSSTAPSARSPSALRSSRELQRPHGRHRQGQARRRQGPVHSLLRVCFHHGPRREDQRGQADVTHPAATERKLKSSQEAGSCAARFFFIATPPAIAGGV